MGTEFISDFKPERAYKLSEPSLKYYIVADQHVLKTFSRLCIKLLIPISGSCFIIITFGSFIIIVHGKKVLCQPRTFIPRADMDWRQDSLVLLDVNVIIRQINTDTNCLCIHLWHGE